MLQRLRESLSLILIAALPMHAMLVTVVTHLIQGQNHAPLVVIALWKEVLLALIVSIALLEIIRTRKSELQHVASSMDILDWCIVFVVLLAVTVSSISGTAFSIDWPLSLADKRFLLGFKFDVLPLVVFMVLRRVLWSRNFLIVAARVIAMIGVVAAVFGIMTLFLPLSFFTAIGYSDLHSLYLPHAPLASFQFLEGTDIRRIQSFMSGPNQFGLWLLLPFLAHLSLFAKAIREHRRFEAILFAIGASVILIALFFTYSRSAWIGAVVIVVTVSVLLLRHMIQSTLHRMVAFLSVSLVGGLIMMFGMQFSPEIFVRSQSFAGHVDKPIAALQIIRAHPFGLGLGAAGPASNRLSDTCVFLNVGDDVAWAKHRSDICVFLGGVQKLPAGEACECPLLTENWYLQWGVEMGFFGLFLSLMLVCLVLVRGLRFSVNHAGMIPVLAFLGVAVAGIFLHSFEDSAVAYSLWLLLSACGLGRRQQHA